MNKIFVESLQKYTKNCYELIIIDNGSTDGSAEYFESVGAKVIRNNGNYSYPVCQNQGIKIAQYPIYAFLNNDIIVAPNWDERLMAVMEKNGLEIVCPSGIERMENPKLTRYYHRKWKGIRNLFSIFGISRFTLKLMFYIMYFNWERFQQNLFNKYQFTAKEGFNGNSVIMTKSAIEKIGEWDERLQNADFDLYLRSKKRSLEFGDIKPVHTALGVFHHHYIRLTAKVKYPPFVDKANIILIEKKWSQREIDWLKAL